MAKVIKQHAFRAFRGSREYADEWFDGRIWELQLGIDFHGSIKIAQSCIVNQARRRGLRGQTQKVGDRIIFRATKSKDAP